MFNRIQLTISYITVLILLTFCAVGTTFAQEDESETDRRPIKSTFESNWLIDNQTVMVPVKGTFEMDIMHRFGTLKNGYDDLFGLYAPSNIRIGFGYVPMDKLMVGFGFTKLNLTWDANIKYAIFRQSRSGGFPVSLTYFGNVVADTRKKENFTNATDRYSYFHQLMVARKLTDQLSVQASVSLSHFNAVEGYINQNLEVDGKMENDHIAIGFMGRYKVTESLAIIANYDQPITKHKVNNPRPNISFGVEMSTSSHAFQVFAGNYSSIHPQYNNMFNQNDYNFVGQFLIGFNITRLWNF